jgi:hypothetical protein
MIYAIAHWNFRGFNSSTIYISAKVYSSVADP